MKILLGIDDYYANDRLAIKLVEEGIEPHKVNDYTNIMPDIEKYEADTILLDIDLPYYNDFKTIKDIKTKLPDINIIVISSKTNIDFVKQIMSLGVYGIVSKLDITKEQFLNMMTLLDQLKTKKNELRKHIRVKPAENQHNFFSISINAIKASYSGTIKDISLGGIAISFTKPPPDSLFFRGKEIVINVELNHINMQLKGIIVLKRGLDAAILFKDLFSTYKKLLAEYIILQIGQ